MSQAETWTASTDIEAEKDILFVPFVGSGSSDGIQEVEIVFESKYTSTMSRDCK